MFLESPAGRLPVEAGSEAQPSPCPSKPMLAAVHRGGGTGVSVMDEQRHVPSGGCGGLTGPSYSPGSCSCWMRMPQSEPWQLGRALRWHLQLVPPAPRPLLFRYERWLESGPDNACELASKMPRWSPYDAGYRRRSTICLRQPPVPLACAVPRSFGLACRAVLNGRRGVCVVLVEVVRGSTRVTKGASLGRHMSTHRSVH